MTKAIELSIKKLNGMKLERHQYERCKEILDAIADEGFCRVDLQDGSIAEICGVRTDTCKGFYFVGSIDDDKPLTWLVGDGYNSNFHERIDGTNNIIGKHTPPLFVRKIIAITEKGECKLMDFQTELDAIDYITIEYKSSPRFKTYLHCESKNRWQEGVDILNGKEGKL